MATPIPTGLRHLSLILQVLFIGCLYMMIDLDELVTKSAKEILDSLNPLVI